ncbi:thiolase family protein [Sulfitobacter donghicola]|uniref:Acetyl-CoA acetyltransferase n=1 Tax=Sulfitobacter donghicola DSW-25 = KCTC 12864 = JCM 14565 TaxID=1300350 RepID=A0A073IKR4_9RHOB|nr:thiolase family protein [Sulfitobacter donghicola]KEJ90923.1 acetyl-CoA acetyltransferase [Sulfitobacter donghicola DSW-25 = KCTC 12864 = JCM 14565]KIN68210.1 Acetyl-CoA C-acetyltransferase [Sulfitobacter donghicola DSW-25 = KCTC 12864 = JCM 14565]
MTARIIAAKRSAVVPRGGAFAALTLDQLAAPVITAALTEMGITADQVDEVIVSNAIGGGGNPARLIALAAGLPESVAGLSIDRQCAGGLDALLLAKAMIESGAADIVVAGGVESYSRRPTRMKTFPDGRPDEPYDQPPFTPWPDRDPDMSEAADDLGKLYGITREAQDTWAISSHEKALAAPPHPKEIVSIKNQDKDPFARRMSGKLAQRAKVITGDITAANTAVAADGAAFCIVVSERISRELDFQGIAIWGGASKGDRPELPGIAPLAAIKAVQAQTGIKPQDINRAEIMEAFAVQAIACVQSADIDPSIVNVGGGALARGHPIGASGAINAVRLFHELKQTGGKGLAAIAAAGGIATAVFLGA